MLFDHEEVGSNSTCGAGSPLLMQTIQNVIAVLADESTATVMKTLKKSFMVSIDMAHAKHPNYQSVHDDTMAPRINGGLVIKTNANQRYATNGVTASLFRQLCAEVDVPVQSFVTRTDLGCGSTIGPVTAAKLGIPTLDVGIPQLAMHSCRELTGTLDPERLSRVLRQFFNRPGRLQVAVGD